MKTTLGIDIGTTSVSMVVLQSDGTLLASKTMKNDAFCEGFHPANRTQDPARILQIVTENAAELLQTCAPIDAIGFTGQMHGMLYTDETGEAVSPLYTWQDGSGDLEIADGITSASYLRERVGNAATGYGITTHYYLQQTNRIPERAVCMTTISDYVAMRMCGLRKPLLSPDMAASWGCIDLRNKRFLMDELAKAGVDVSYLPELKEDYCVIGTTKEGIPVWSSPGDNQASVYGALHGVTDAVVLNIGTGSQISLPTDAHYDVHGDMELRPAGASYLLAGFGLCGGRSYAMLEEFYRAVPGVTDGNLYGLMAAQAEEYIGVHGIDSVWDVRTQFAGTRSDPSKRGSIHGIGTDNFHPGAFTAGMILGILKELHEIYLQMTKITGRTPSRLVGSGNGLRKNLLMQRLAAKMFGLPFQLATLEEEAACGAALIAQRE